MKLKKDWSLAYFLYYFCWLGYWTIILSFITILLTSSLFFSTGQIRVMQIPVSIQSAQFSSYDDLGNESIKIHIPETVQSHIDVSAEVGESASEIIILFAVKFYDGFIAFLTFFFLSRVLKKVAENDPFHPNNSTNLYTIGWIMIAAGIISLLLYYLPLPLFDSVNSSTGIQITNLNLRGDLYLLGGILTIVISYIFKEGAQLYNEQKLTV